MPKEAGLTQQADQSIGIIRRNPVHTQCDHAFHVFRMIHCPDGDQNSAPVGFFNEGRRGMGFGLDKTTAAVDKVAWRVAFGGDVRGPY